MFNQIMVFCFLLCIITLPLISRVKKEKNFYHIDYNMISNVDGVYVDTNLKDSLCRYEKAK